MQSLSSFPLPIQGALCQLLTLSTARKCPRALGAVWMCSSAVISVISVLFSPLLSCQAGLWRCRARMTQTQSIFCQISQTSISVQRELLFTATILCAAFVKEQFCHRGENCRILVLEQGFVVLRACWEAEICCVLGRAHQCLPAEQGSILSLWFCVLSHRRSQSCWDSLVLPCLQEQGEQMALPWMGTQQLGTSIYGPAIVNN